jgi:hypothetical protein
VRRLFAGFVMASAALAQTPGAVEGPTLGLVFDADAAVVRPLLGVPGSASLGAPLDAMSGLRGVVASAQRGYALGIDASGSAVVATAGGARTLPGAGVTRVFVSPRGSAAAAYRGQAGVLDVLTGMPDAPRVARTVAFDTPPADLAVSDDGAAVVALIRAGRGFETISWREGDSTAQTIYHTRRVESLAFLPGSSTAVVAEANAVKLLSPAFGAQPIAEGLSGVIAAAGSSDGSRVVIAMRSGKVAVVDRASSTRVSLTCACVPNALAPLRGSAVFRLNSPGDGPLWLLDADGPEPRILFVATQAGGVQ